MLAHVQPARAGAASGILTTTQQFGAASGIAVIGAVFYGALGTGAGSRGMFVHGMELGMTIDAILLVVAVAVTLLLPRRAAARAVAAVSSDAPASAGAGAPEPAVHAWIAE